MTEKEREVKNWEVSVRESEMKLADARVAMDCGWRKAQADLERERSRLVSEVRSAEARLERDKNYLSQARATLEKGFEE